MIEHKLFIYTPLNVKIALFQTIQFSISTQFNSIWPIECTLSGATTSSQSGAGSDGNEGALCTPESSSITGDSPSDYLVSYLGHSLGGGILLLCKDAVDVFYSPTDWAPGHLLG